MTKLCPRGKAAAKRKFKVYPSAYANAYASKICAGKIKDPSGVKRKDFRGRKPAAEGGRINKMTAEKRKSLSIRGSRREKVSPEMNEKLNEQRRRELSLIKAKPPKSGPRSKPRPKMMGGGLMEATAKLKRQGLKDGKKVFPTHPSREQEARDYYTKLYGSKEAKAELGERTRDRRKVKKMGGGMISRPRAMYRKGGGVCLRGMNRDAIGKNS